MPIGHVLQTRKGLDRRDPDSRSDVLTLLDAARSEMDSALTSMRSSSPVLEDVASILSGCLQRGNKILVAGNGGSASEAQHFVAELVGRFKIERSAYAVLALTSDSAVVTALSNDYGYDHVFSRQVQALGQPGDVLVLFSTSGESENVVQAVHAATRAGCISVSITGHRPCRLGKAADYTIPAPAVESSRIQEIHMVITHLLCQLVEEEMTRDTANTYPGSSAQTIGIGLT